MYRHTSIIISLYVKLKRVHTDVSNSNSVEHGSLQPSCLSVISMSNSEKTVSNHSPSTIHLIVYSSPVYAERSFRIVNPYLCEKHFGFQWKHHFSVTEVSYHFHPPPLVSLCSVFVIQLESFVTDCIPSWDPWTTGWFFLFVYIKVNCSWCTVLQALQNV